MTLSAVHGWGIPRGLADAGQAGAAAIRVVPKLKVDMVVPLHEADSVVGRLRQVLDSSDLGPGKIFVSDVDDAAHTRSDERGQGV